MPIAEGICAAKAALETSKLLMDLVNSPKINADMVRAKVQEMLIHVVNASSALSEAHVENMELRQKLDDRTAHEELVADVEVDKDGHFVVRKSEQSEGRCIPYCPVCWGRDTKLVAMAPYTKPGLFRCPLHPNTAYSTPAYEEWRKNQPARPKVVSSNWLRRNEWW